MSEVVVEIGDEEGRDASRLTSAIDAFTRWALEAGNWAQTDDGPEIMMMTECAGGEIRRRLVFQDGEHAARFLLFWRTGATPAPVEA